MIVRTPSSESLELDIVGSSTFGRYPKISSCKTYNMFESDSALVPYAGYKVAINAFQLGAAKEGRGVYSSVTLNRIVCVVGPYVYLLKISYNQTLDKVSSYQSIRVGTLNTSSGTVYIAENNRSQIGISDGVNFYIYDASLNPFFQQVPLDFVPGYLTFHNSYFILAASQDSFAQTQTQSNTWRLSESNNGLSWPSTRRNIGLLETKADNTQAVVRFPSKGNMILVMGKAVTEAWFNTGSQQIFPYQRNSQFNIDYGCLNPATVAYTDEIVVWLASNELSGPIILYSSGGAPQKITSDGIDFLLSTLQHPSDAQGFLYRQDGHLFYHINFYKDNLSLFYDFNTQKFYHACDSYYNFFIAAQVAYYENQYYFVSKKNGNVYAFDTTITTYQDVTASGDLQTRQVPRSRICSNIRKADQSYMIINDVSFTVETGLTSYAQQYYTENGEQKLSQDSDFSLPRIDMSLSSDGGQSFSSTYSQSLPGIGQGKSKIQFWGLGAANDAVLQFNFWSFGRVVVFNGICSVRS